MFITMYYVRWYIISTHRVDQYYHCLDNFVTKIKQLLDNYRAVIGHRHTCCGLPRISVAPKLRFNKLKQIKLILLTATFHYNMRETIKRIL